MRGGRFLFMELVRTAVLFAVLYGFWLLLSGHYTTWLNVWGFVLCAAVSIWALIIGVSDEEGHPVHLLTNAVFYWPWLVIEIIKSAIDVSMRIVNPKLPITPGLKRFSASQKTPVGLTTFANSITLTPGTISVMVDWQDHDIIVHALSREGLDSLDEGTMDRKVTAFEGED